MGCDRVRIKNAARAIIREARPRPWLVTLVYSLLASALPGVVMTAIFWPFITLSAASSATGVFGAADPWSSPRLGGLSIALMVFLYLLVLLFMSLMQVGYQHYCMKLWRGQQTDFKDVFHGFSIAPRALALFGLILLFTFLWSLPAIFVMALVAGICAAFSPTALATLVFLMEIGLMAYLYNRTLRYALAYYVLLDHPDYTALEALNESKALMSGRRWELFVVYLSFFGWSLLIGLIIYAVLLIGVLLMIFVLAYSFETLNPVLGISSILLPFLLLGIGYLASAPLSLWLQAYQGASLAGYYDCVAYPAPPPEPEWQPQPPAPSTGFYTSPAGEAPPPPPPPVNDGPAGTFYRGFITPAAPPDEAPQPEGPPPDPEVPAPEEPPAPPEAPEQ